MVIRGTVNIYLYSDTYLLEYVLVSLSTNTPHRLYYKFPDMQICQHHITILIYVDTAVPYFACLQELHYYDNSANVHVCVFMYSYYSLNYKIHIIQTTTKNIIGNKVE